jgi:hypothetical protein
LEQLYPRLGLYLKKYPVRRESSASELRFHTSGLTPALVAAWAAVLPINYRPLKLLSCEYFLPDFCAHFNPNLLV